MEQFFELLSGILSDGNKEEFQELFDVIDTDKEGFVDWDKFCSHMQQDYQEKDDRLKTTQVPYKFYFTCVLLIHAWWVHGWVRRWMGGWILDWWVGGLIGGWITGFWIGGWVD